MLLSIYVYSFLAITMYILGKLHFKHNFKKNKAQLSFVSIEIVLLFIIFSLVSGIRWNVGTDHLSYLQEYINIKNGFNFSGNNIEFGFQLITNLFATNKIHFTIYFAFIAFLQLFFVYYSFKKEPFIFQYLGLLIILGGQYLLWMNGIRQTLAACIFVFSIHFIKEKKIIKYVATILFATTIHKSAIILLLFYLFIDYNLFKNKYITLLLLALSYFLGSSSTLLSNNEYVTNFLSFIGYDTYAQRLDYYIFERAKEMGFGPRRFILLIFSIYVILYSEKLKKKYSNFCIYYNLTIIGVLLFNLFANSGSIFLRPTYYFQIFLPVSLSYLIHYLNINSKNKFALHSLVIIILALLYMLAALISENGKGVLDFTNYKFFWDYNLS